jgi:two-component system, cell cycle response regulator
MQYHGDMSDTVAPRRDDDTARVDVEDGLRSSVERGPKSEAVLTMLRGANPGFLYTLEGNEAVIGRSPEVAVSIPDDTLSRRHACIRRDDQGFSIEDMGSTNGTFVDGARVQGSQRLADGCRISLGARIVLHFALHDSVELEAARQTHDLTVRDPLTRVFNRRHLEERFAGEVAFANRHKTPLSLLLLDIDHFKEINDRFGHVAGDAALRSLARALLAMVRQEDVLGRYGGEEFAIVARGIDRRGTALFAERMRRGVQELHVPTEDGSLSFTVSIGVAYERGVDGCDAVRMFEAADRALYAAKAAGRNRVELAPDMRPESASLSDSN